MRALIGKIDKRTINAIIVTILVTVMYKYIWPLLSKQYDFFKHIRDYRKLILAIVFITPVLLNEHSQSKRLVSLSVN